MAPVPFRRDGLFALSRLGSKNLLKRALAIASATGQKHAHYRQ